MRMTGDHPDPSAKAPCTSTIDGFGAGSAIFPAAWLSVEPEDSTAQTVRVAVIVSSPMTMGLAFIASFLFPCVELAFVDPDVPLRIMCSSHTLLLDRPIASCRVLVRKIRPERAARSIQFRP